MNTAFLGLLRDPVHLKPLSFQTMSRADLEGKNGTLVSQEGSSYIVKNGIPRFVTPKDPGQTQTNQTFGFKWKKRETYDSPEFKALNLKWYLEKYGFESLQTWTSFLTQRSRILDLGCGSGFSSSIWLESPFWNPHSMCVGADLSEAVDVAQERLGHISNVYFLQADALSLPFAEGTFDLIFSEGALHHTPSTKKAILSSARILKKGGEYHFYVYKKKGPAREFVDDYIREQIKNLTDEEAWDQMRSLTLLGKKLSELKATIYLEEDVPLLGIKNGTEDIQRFVYWNFAKLYWNEHLSFEENVHVNFDWYRPTYAHRQTPDEVRQWCQEAGLKIYWFHEQTSGITVKAIKE